MSKKPVNALWIDSATQTISEVTVATYKDMQARVGGLFQIAFEFTGGDTLYVDEEGLMKPQTHFFRIKGLDHMFAGNGLVVGCTRSGNNANVKATVAVLRDLITFHDRRQADAWGKANASDPATIVSFGEDDVHVVSHLGELYANMPRPPDQKE